MVSARHEVEVEVAAEQVWDAVRDVVAVHRRLVPGLAVSARLEGDFRILTFPDGHWPAPGWQLTTRRPRLSNWR
jgi:hypothetical protein